MVLIGASYSLFVVLTQVWLYSHCKLPLWGPEIAMLSETYLAHMVHRVTLGI